VDVYNPTISTAVITFA